MKKLTIPIYVVAVALVAAWVTTTLDWTAFFGLPTRHLVGLGALMLLAILSEYFAIPMVVGRSEGTYSMTFILLFAGVLVFGPAPTALVACVATLVYQFGFRRKGALRAVFNAAQFTLATAVAGKAYVAFGGVASTSELHANVPAFLAFAATFSLLNLLLTAVVIALYQDLPLRQVIVRLAGGWGANLFYDILVSPFALLIASFYRQYWVWGLVGVLFLLHWIRRSYVTNFQLQQANRDLLKALVKAIETRDPYTSGHSMRVATLASRVSTRLTLSSRQIENIETAALLHDVGKIDAIYTEILKKKGSLSDEEWEIIKSHVDKGVELLTSLSSFHSDVILSVKHHHERYDGSGYPDGLVGEAIPLGARIIKICDAVDAMLSDRPYRKALSLPDVREQLMLFAEREFDPTLVSVFFKEGFLEEHAGEAREELNHPRFAHAEPEARPVQVTLTR